MSRQPFSAHPPGCRCGGSVLACDATSSEAIGTAAIRVAAERAAFGGEAGRRRVLKLLGAATVAAAMDRVFPILRAQEAWAEGAGGAPEKKDLKVGFIAITCATPIILAAPMGFYAKQGLNVDVVRTAGWAVVRDKALNGEYDAAHMLSPMPLALTLGAGSQPTPFARAGDREHQRPGDHPGHEAQGQPRPDQVEGHEVRHPVRLLDAQLPAALLPGRGRARPRPRRAAPRHPAARDGGQPAGGEHRRLPRPRPVQPARRVRRRRLHPPADARDVGRPPVLRLRHQPGVDRQGAEHLPRPAAGDRRQHRLANKAENRKQIAEAISAAELPQPAADRGGAGADRHLRRRAGRREEGAGPGGLRPVPLPVHGHLDHDPDEALGADQGRRRLAGRGPAGLPRHRCGRADEGGRARPCRPRRTRSYTVMGKTFDPAKPDDYVASFPIKRT